MGDTFHFTQTVFLGVDDEASKEALWALFDALAFKLMLRTQVQGGLQGDEGEDFWRELIVNHPKILLVTAVTTDKAQTGLFISADAVDQYFENLRTLGPDADTDFLLRFLIDHPHVPVLQATAMFLAVRIIIEMGKEKEDPSIPFPSCYVYIRQPPPLDQVVPRELF